MTTWDMTIDLADGGTEHRRNLPVDEMRSLVYYYVLVDAQKITIANRGADPVVITDVDRVLILTHGVHVDEQQISELVDAASALYVGDGEFQPTAEAVEALWEVIRWHRRIDEEHPDPEPATLTDAGVSDLIDRSSFGSPEVKEIRARTPPEVTAELLERLRGRDESDDDVDDT